MDVNTLRGLATLLALIAFIAICVWAYNSKRKQRFDNDAQLPFADEESHRLSQQQQSNSEDKDKQ
jgi:cytochrome c oxidase cbb3-type subunit 4